MISFLDELIPHPVALSRRQAGDDPGEFIIRFLERVTAWRRAASSVMKLNRYLNHDAKAYFITAQLFTSTMDYDYELLAKLKLTDYIYCDTDANLESLHNQCNRVRKYHTHTGAGQIHPEALLVALWFTGIKLEVGQDDEVVEHLNGLLKVRSDHTIGFQITETPDKK